MSFAVPKLATDFATREYLPNTASKNPRKGSIMIIDDIQYRSAILEGAQDPETLGATLSRWAKNEDPSIRLAVANNPSTPLDTIYALSRDEDLSVEAAGLSQLTFHSIFGALSNVPAAA